MMMTALSSSQRQDRAGSESPWPGEGGRKDGRPKNELGNKEIRQQQKPEPRAGDSPHADE